jgi:hypothetical protein
MSRKNGESMEIIWKFTVGAGFMIAEGASGL